MQDPAKVSGQMKNLNTSFLGWYLRCLLNNSWLTVKLLFFHVFPPLCMFRTRRSTSHLGFSLRYDCIYRFLSNRTGKSTARLELTALPLDDHDHLLAQGKDPYGGRSEGGGILTSDPSGASQASTLLAFNDLTLCRNCPLAILAPGHAAGESHVYQTVYFQAG